MHFPADTLYVLKEIYLRDTQHFVEILINFLDHIEHFQFVVVPRMGKFKHVQKIENLKSDQWYVHFCPLHLDIVINTRAFLRRFLCAKIEFY